MEWDLLLTCERSEPENVHQGKLLPLFLSYMHYLLEKKFLLLSVRVKVLNIRQSQLLYTVMLNVFGVQSTHQ